MRVCVLATYLITELHRIFYSNVIDVYDITRYMNELVFETIFFLAMQWFTLTANNVCVEYYY